MVSFELGEEIKKDVFFRLVTSVEKTRKDLLLDVSGSS